MTKLASEKASDLEDMTRWRVSAIREKFEGIINAIDASEKNEESDGLLCLACRHMKGINGPKDRFWKLRIPATSIRNRRLFKYKFPKIGDC